MSESKHMNEPKAMNRVIGVWLWLCENEADEPTVTVVGKGEFKDGPQEGTACGFAEEGLLSASFGSGEIITFVSVDVEGDSAHDKMFKVFDESAAIMASQLGLGKRVELVRFGNFGRKHVKFYEPS